MSDFAPESQGWEGAAARAPGSAEGHLFTVITFFSYLSPNQKDMES